jgi:hypothetical protein
MNFAGNAGMSANRALGQPSLTAPAIYPNEQKENTNRMDYEFMITDTPLPPCVPLPRAAVNLPISSTAKVLYARLLGEILTNGIPDRNGILFIRFPIMELAAALSRSPMTVKRSLNELEQAGMIMRVRRNVGEANHIYILLPKEGDSYE